MARVSRGVKWMIWGALALAAVAVAGLNSIRSQTVVCLCSGCGRQVSVTQTRSWVHESPWRVTRERDTTLSGFLGVAGACAHSTGGLREAGILCVDGFAIEGSPERLCPSDIYDTREWPFRRLAGHGTCDISMFALLHARNLRDGRLLGMDAAGIRDGLRKPRGERPRWRDLEAALSASGGTTTPQDSVTPPRN